MSQPCENNAFCEYRFAELNKKLDDLHVDLRELHRTVKNGISEKITQHDTHLRFQWWFIAGLLCSMGAVSFFVFKKIMNG